jgi:hypothetical protein
MPHPAESRHTRLDMVGHDRHPSIMQLGSCRSALSKGTLEGICTLVCRDQYRSVHRRMAAAQPGEYSGGIVRGIEGHDKGERRFICLKLQCGIVKMPPGGLPQKPITANEGTRKNARSAKSTALLVANLGPGIDFVAWPIRWIRTRIPAGRGLMSKMLPNFRQGAKREREIERKPQLGFTLPDDLTAVRPIVWSDHLLSDDSFAFFQLVLIG